MQDTAGTWLMTALTTSPLLIALMQTAASLPVLFLGLPAGATADIFDRRRLLIFWQTWMLATVAILSALTIFGVISPADAIGAHLPAEYRQRDEQSGVAGDCPGTGAARRVAGRHRAQQRRRSIWPAPWDLRWGASRWPLSVRPAWARPWSFC